MIKMTKKMLPPMMLALAAAPLATAADHGPLTGELRTFYFDRDFQDGGTDRVSLTQALILNYNTPLSERFEFGASLYSNLKLNSRGDEHLIGTLDSSGDGYAKLGQIYLDTHLGEHTKLRIGRWSTTRALFNDNDNRATPPSTQGIMLDTRLAGTDLYAIYSDRASAKAESAFKEYVDADGDSYAVFFVGAHRDFDNGLSLTGEYGHAGDFTEQLYLNASYTLDNGVLIDFRQFFAEYGDAHTSTALQNQDSRISNLAVQVPVTDNLKLTASYQGVGGDAAYNYSWGGKDDKYLATWHAIQYSDFNRLDEQSVQLRADYTTPIPGLDLTVRHVEGEFKSGGEDQYHRETNYDARYAVQGVDGLKLRARFARVRVETGGEDINEIRLYANYAF